VPTGSFHGLLIEAEAAFLRSCLTICFDSDPSPTPTRNPLVEQTWAVREPGGRLINHVTYRSSLDSRYILCYKNE
jgi:hypothetical protein